ncbi:MAG: CdaR family protein [Myxococcota bacterium]|nr:CdaR family protein [Myxococcota bacterium]
MSWLFSDFQYKLLALVVAVLLWSLSQGTSSIERGFDVPVAIQERPDNLVVTRRSADAVNIRVRGTRAALRSLSGENLEYVVNLSGAKSGRAEFEVDLTPLLAQLPRGAQIVSRSPFELELELEPKGSKMVKLEPEVVGDPAPGFLVAGVLVEPPRIRITGARDEVRRLEQLLTETVYVNGASETFEQTVRPSIRGDNLWIEPEQGQEVTVRVQVVPEPVPEDAEDAAAEGGEAQGGGAAAG